jgi:processive 1,2-diacylglycerol beta-glucosyltransferase
VIGVVTDYAAHAFWAESGVDRFCGPSGATMRDLARHGVPIDRLCGTGIPIRPAFGRIPQLVLPRAGQPLRALITSGGFGVGPLLDVLRSFARVPDMKLTVVCGDNADRVARATRLATELRLDAEVVGFEPNMPRRMAEAHVIVGKPGGLTVSESLAAGRPLVLVGACPGQETKNQSWLVERGAAYASSPLAVGATLALLNQHDELARIAEAARALATPNAAFNVVDVALTLSRSAPRMPLAA